MKEKERLGHRKAADRLRRSIQVTLVNVRLPPLIASLRRFSSRSAYWKRLQSKSTWVMLFGFAWLAYLMQLLMGLHKYGNESGELSQVRIL